MTGDEKLKEILLTVADEARQIRDLEKGKLCGEEVNQHDITNWARDKRKLLEPFVYDMACKIPEPPPGSGDAEAEEALEPPTPPRKKTRESITLDQLHDYPVCMGLEKARDIHQHYIGLPPDPKTGSIEWHEGWVGLYDRALETCGCHRTLPPTPPEDADPGVILKRYLDIAPCMGDLTKKEQKGILELAKMYQAGGKLAQTQYSQLADYVECLSSHAGHDGEDELLQLTGNLRGAACDQGGLERPVELVKPEEEISDIRRIPLDQIDIRPEKYQYRRGGAEQVGLDREHAQNIVNTFEPERMTPIEVREIEARYELLSGHHRFEAFKLAKAAGGFPGHPDYNVSSIPAMIRHVDDETAKQLARLSNAQTKEYTPSEFAKIVELEMSMGIAPETIAKSYGNRKVSEVLRFHDIAALPETLLDILDNPTLRKTFTLDHAAVLGHAMREYGLAPAEAQTIFNRILKEGEYTAYQLERMLKTLGPEIKEAQVDMFAGMDIEGGKTGVIDALKEVMDAIKTQETQKRRLRGFSNFIQEKRKALEEIPEEFSVAYDTVQREIEAAAKRIDDLRIGIGQRLTNMPVKEALVLAPVPPPSAEKVAELAQEIETRVAKDEPWAFLENKLEFGNLSYEERDIAWDYRPLRELLLAAIGMGGGVALHSLNKAIPGYIQITLNNLPHSKEDQLTKMAYKIPTLKGIATPYTGERVFLMTLPSQNVELEELLGSPQYLPEAKVKGESGEQAQLFVPTPPPGNISQEIIHPEIEYCSIIR
jgi:ParB/RepB/Spo0J family partition protein